MSECRKRERKGRERKGKVRAEFKGDVVEEEGSAAPFATKQINIASIS